MQKQNWNGKKVIAIALVFGLAAGLAFQGTGYGIKKYETAKVQKQLSASATSTSNKDKITTVDVSQVAQNVMPSIVSITSKIEQTYDFGFFFGQQTQEVEGSGSGIIISQNGDELLVVTNHHVIEGAKNISIGFSDGKTANAVVKGSDSDADLAVLSVPMSELDKDTLKEIKIAVIGDSDSLTVGETAIAIGNALGYGQSVTVGYISAKDREVEMSDSGTTMNLVQTDAAINPGNSGGALLNLKGELIGINTVKYSDDSVEGMGYAIPISYAVPIIEDLLYDTKIPKGKEAYLGISGIDVSKNNLIGSQVSAGIYIEAIAEDSPAQKAGLCAGDIITKFDHVPVSSMNGLVARLGKHKEGDEVELTVYRRTQRGDYEEKKIVVTLGTNK